MEQSYRFGEAVDTGKGTVPTNDTINHANAFRAVWGEKAVVLFSGGLDSTVLLHWAIRAYGLRNVYPLLIDYGQSNRAEIEAGETICTQLGIDNYLCIGVEGVLKGSAPLINKGAKFVEYGSVAEMPTGIDNDFIPGRNLFFLSIAANYAYTVNANSIITGVVRDAYEGFPDCRPNFLHSAELAMSLGMERDIEIKAPLTRFGKDDVIKLGSILGKECWSSMSHSVTCYQMDGVTQVVPCDRCHSCVIRREGFEKANLFDPQWARLKSADKVDNGGNGQ